jgi:hypothetical protein
MVATTRSSTPQLSIGTSSREFWKTVNPIFCTENLSPIAEMIPTLFRPAPGAMFEVRSWLV